jgi:hypothetical protein
VVEILDFFVKADEERKRMPLNCHYEAECDFCGHKEMIGNFTRKLSAVEEAVALGWKKKIDEFLCPECVKVEHELTFKSTLKS